MKLWFAEFSWFSAGVMVLAANAGGLLSMIATFYLMKNVLMPVREELGARVSDSNLRRSLVRQIPLSHKLSIAVGGAMTVAMAFALQMAHVRANHANEALANRVQEHVLALAADDLAERGSLRQPGDDASQRALGTRLVLLDGAAEAVLAGAPDVLLPGELRTLRELQEAGDDGGTSNGFDSPHSFVWRRVPAGVLVAVADPVALASGSSDGLALLLALVGIALAIALGIARLAAQDVSRVTRLVTIEVERVASGDLTGGRVVESEDELGDLSHRVELMAGALHQTVGRVVEAAHAVEGAAATLSTVGADVASVTEDQVDGLESVTGSMERIRAEVRGITESAHGLSMSVEESSSSVLELGVTGEELNQNATALNERVAEVSSSIEQMMQSSRSVFGSLEELAGASAETSSSMEEMAASLREVDTNAAETARLSENVVQIAERGRQKVDQTIRGMHAIQEATDTAQGVINGLGRRADEIGQILNVIDDVAEETNLLALNAAIIAAQAGEHGRAFSVVADEIKDLAEKVFASTKEIGGLIRGVQGEAANAVGAIEGGARSVESGVNLSAEAGVALEEITSAAGQSGERISEIVAAVREQSRAAVHVVSLMDQVRDGAEGSRTAGHEQTRGNEVVLRGATAMSEVSLQVSGATEEQAHGARRMREAIENVRGAVEQINQSLQQQSDACEQIAGLLERVTQRTHTNEESASRMRDATRGLLEHAEGLRESVRHFHV
jgi:methyl-accepting chemotaxis protein